MLLERQQEAEDCVPELHREGAQEVDVVVQGRGRHQHRQLLLGQAKK